MTKEFRRRMKRAAPEKRSACKENNDSFQERVGLNHSRAQGAGVFEERDASRRALEIGEAENVDH
jgi:hypothetical protein